VRKVLAASAVIALLFVVAGCPAGQNVTELQNKVSGMEQQITELQHQVQMLTMERDSLQTMVNDLMAKKGTTGKTESGTKTGGTAKDELKPPTKK